jgi:simple sugar transport system ATP-binding protein
VGDRFTILNRGRSLGTYTKKGLAAMPEFAAPTTDQITLEELVSMMAGGRELVELSHELEQFGGGAAAAAAEVQKEAGV